MIHKKITIKFILFQKNVIQLQVAVPLILLLRNITDKNSNEIDSFIEKCMFKENSIEMNSSIEKYN